MPIFIISMISGFIQIPRIEFFVLFLLAVFGAVTISYLIELIVGILTFYTVSSWGLQCFKQAFMSFFSGSLIPIELMPIWLQNIAELMPFKSMIYFPVSICLGNLSATQILQGFTMQIVWILLLIVVSNFIYKMAIKKVTIAGG